MTTELERLDGEHEAALDKRRAEEQRRRDFLAQRHAEAGVEAARLFDATLEGFREQETAARIAYQDELIRVRTADTEWLPVGTKVVKKKRDRRSWVADSHKLIYGVVEIWTRESVRPDNIAWPPHVGAVIVRLLRVDGSTSSRYEDRLYGWEVAP